MGNCTKHPTEREGLPQKLGQPENLAQEMQIAAHILQQVIHIWVGTDLEHSEFITSLSSVINLERCENIAQVDAAVEKHKGKYIKIITSGLLEEEICGRYNLDWSISSIILFNNDISMARRLEKKYSKINFVTDQFYALRNYLLSDIEHKWKINQDLHIKESSNQNELLMMYKYYEKGAGSTEKQQKDIIKNLLTFIAKKYQIQHILPYAETLELSPKQNMVELLSSENTYLLLNSIINNCKEVLEKLSARFPLLQLINTIENEPNEEKISAAVIRKQISNQKQFYELASLQNKTIQLNSFYRFSLKPIENPMTQGQVTVKIINMDTNFINLKKYVNQELVLVHPLQQFKVLKVASNKINCNIEITLEPTVNKFFLNEHIIDLDTGEYNSEEIYLLSPQADVRQLLYRKFSYLWIDSKVNSEENKKHQKMISEFHPLHTCETKGELLNLIENYQEEKCRIITSLSYAEEVCKYFEKDDRVQYIYIVSTDISMAEDIQRKYQKVKSVKNSMKDFVYCLEDLLSDKQNSLVVPVYAKTNDEKATVKRLRLTLHQLLKMENKKTARQDFIRLVSFLFKADTKNIEKFKRQYAFNMQPEKVISWYTDDTFYYRILNNLLKVGNIMDLAYVRLAFCDLFNSIRTLYKRQDKKTNNHTLYRAGKMTEKQIQFMKDSKGKLIEVFGFLTTTKNQSTAIETAANMYFIIHTSGQSKFQEADYGYVETNKKTAEKDEVLFNALNLFKIINVKDNVIKEGNKQKKLIVVELKYGQTAEVSKINPASKIEENQNQVFNLKNKQKIIQLTDQGKVFKECQQYMKEEEFYNLKLNVLKNKESKEAADCYNYLGIIYRNRLQYDQAIDYYTKSLNIRRKVLGEQHLDTAASYNHLAHNYDRKNQLGQSIQFGKKGLDIQIKVLGQQHIKVATSYNILGQRYEKNNEFDKAVESHTKALNIFRKISGEQDISTGASYNHIGHTYDKKKDFNKALEFYTKGLQIFLKVLGQDHIQTATCYSNFGSIYEKQCEYDKAIECYTKDLNISKKILGLGHVYTATCYNHLAGVYKSKLEYEKAIENYNHALDIEKQKSGPTHESTKLTLKNIGSCYKAMGQTKKAQEYMDKAK